MVDNIRPYRILVVMTVIVPLFLFVIVMWQDYRNIMNDAQRDGNRHVAIFEQHALKVFETHHLACERVNERLRGMSWDEIARSTTLRDFLQKICDHHPQIQAIWLADPAGIVRNGSQPLPATLVSVVDRDYYTTLKNGDADLFVGHLVKARVLQGLNFNIAHRRENDRGSFDGIIIITVFPEFFSNFWNKTIIADDIIAALIRSDGMMLARAPHLMPNLLQLPPTSPMLQAVRTADHGTFVGTSANDGSKRFYTFRKVGGFNVYMVYGVGSKALRKEWLQDALIYGSIFAVAVLALLTVSLLTLKRAQQQQRAEAALSLAYAEVESRVQERTAELNMTNNALIEEALEHKRTEAALRKSELLYHSVVTSMAEGVWLQLASGEISAVNPAAEKIEGRTAAEILGRTSGELHQGAICADGSTFPSEFHPSMLTLRTGEPQADVEMGIHRPDGTLVWISVNSAPLFTAGESVPYAVVTTFHDITAFKYANMEKEQYFNFFQSSSDLMCIADPNGCFKRVNPVFTEVLCYSEEELLAKPFIQFVHPEDQQSTLEEMARQIKHGYSLNFENRYLGKDGTIHWLSWRASYHAKEEITYATARDITEIKRIETYLRNINEELEQRVKERTVELENKNNELARLNQVFIGRELRMIELKKKIKDLEEDHLRRTS